MTRSHPCLFYVGWVLVGLGIGYCLGMAFKLIAAWMVTIVALAVGG
jgi:hypothetical protein